MIRTALTLAALFTSLAFGQTTLPKIWVVGDSTASNSAKGQQGWGDPFKNYFDPAKTTVINRARAGRSSRTFQVEGAWDKVTAEVKPGDFVLIQFGHNDSGAPDKDRARGSLPGIGEEEKEFTMPDGHKELVHTFGWYLRKYVADTKAKGANPVLLSLTVRNIWKDGKVERGSGHFGQWSREVAEAQGVPFVDLTAAIADKYDAMGEAKVKEFFPGDHTHTNPAGADFNAAAVVAGLKTIKPMAALLAAAPAKPTLYLIGDSTVRNGQGNGSNGQWGWGEPLAGYFDPAKITLLNKAVGGLSSRTFLTMGHWDKVLDTLKPGDYVIMQFGHNDNGPLDDASRARGTIKGVGDESKEIDNPITKKHETVHSYGWYLTKFVQDAKAKGATPVMCSLVPRKTWKEGKIARSKGDYAGWAEEVAKKEGIAFVDLNEIIARQYDALGEAKVEPMFADPHTHTSLVGAELNAASVISGLKGLPVDPLAAYFTNKAKDVQPFEAAR